MNKKYFIMLAEAYIEDYRYLTNLEESLLRFGICAELNPPLSIGVEGILNEFNECTVEYLIEYAEQGEVVIEGATCRSLEDIYKMLF